ncbi:MAG: DUF2231 domain-containing protein [Bacteroidota bacterium]
MKSKVNIKGHPLHPMLVMFPIAFFTATMVFRFLSLLMRDASFAQTSFYMNVAGLFCSVAAAVPGIIDYTFTVPPGSTAKKRGARHGILNVIVILLFLMALLLGLNFPTMQVPVLLVEMAGVAIMIVAGWLGGTLVSRNQIGIDIRYANAGKWKELYIKQNSDLVEIGPDNLLLNQMMLVHVKGKRIVIAKTENGIAAFNDRCTHNGGSLAAGSLIRGVVQCPWHGSQFDTVTGEAICGPAHRGVKMYSAFIKDDIIMLELIPGNESELIKITHTEVK